MKKILLKLTKLFMILGGVKKLIGLNDYNTHLAITTTSSCSCFLLCQQLSLHVTIKICDKMAEALHNPLVPEIPAMPIVRPIKAGL